MLIVEDSTVIVSVVPFNLCLRCWIVSNDHLHPYPILLTMQNVFSYTVYLGSEIAISGADPWFVVKGGVSRRGVWGPLKVPRGVLVGYPGDLKLWGFEESQTFIWTTFLNQPHHFYQTKKTWLWVLILSDNC